MVRVTVHSVRHFPDSLRTQLFLREYQGNRFLITAIPSTEAEAIVSAIVGRTSSEIYHTYDLLRLVIEGLSARVDMAVVREIVRSEWMSFQARLVLRSGRQQHDIACSAPVAIAIATFTHADVFVEESVMSDAIVRKLDREYAAVLDDMMCLYDAGSSGAITEGPGRSTAMSRILSSTAMSLTGTDVRVDLTEVRANPIFPIGVVVLSDPHDKRALPIWMGNIEAAVMERVIENDAPPGPHDVLCDVTDALSFPVVATVIHECPQYNTSRAKLLFGSGDRRFGVECRACDAIAAALSAGAPIYVSESVLSRHGVIPDFTTTADDEETEPRPDLARFEGLYADFRRVLGEVNGSERRYVGFPSGQEVKSLIAIINPSPWKFWVGIKRQNEAANRLREVSVTHPDPAIRQAAARAIHKFRSDH